MQNYDYDSASLKFRGKRRYELHEGEVYFMAVPRRNHLE